MAVGRAAKLAVWTKNPYSMQPLDAGSSRPASDPRSRLTYVWIPNNRSHPCNVPETIFVTLAATSSNVAVSRLICEGDEVISAP